LIIELGGIGLAFGIAEKEWNGIVRLIFRRRASSECVTPGAKAGAGNIVFEIVGAGLVGPIACRMIHHGVVPHYFDATTGEPGANLFIDLVAPERPATVGSESASDSAQNAALGGAKWIKL